ncbi:MULTISPECIES: DUF3949 domain-containing protein [Bacillus]|uniref:DUF3949 domain-containing protein n=2 Tax=Bacillus infantis TaxID=324767 RepID=U5LDH3_9BACI|nr:MULTISPECIES: DUF3949 domain-containing protein [Bacillus]OXT18142.1 hypothetical protein B9K06_06435 [Bacillus sp. OG2]AGX04662.1 hypothetical protein N288_13800 [Bacillus infantis NRRL B-14911]EAR68265.1 hypothetical protein B14911_26440 [Bacillus sp. NRRL B-14911]MCA1035069.1 DUF3949 domain-containing protein [Bacillus infantis]MCK6205568.1 DUF3949 domain-containing protein [Bacillus infantis]
MDRMIFLWIAGIYLLLSFILAPVQYGYIKELKKMDQERKAQGKAQDEFYESMAFENQLLHYNAQGFLFWGANLIASLFYRLKNR